jgi:hypothetical protein
LGYDGAGLRTMALLTLMAFGRGGCLWLVEKEGGWYALGGSRRINYLGVFFYLLFTRITCFLCRIYGEKNVFDFFNFIFFYPPPFVCGITTYYRLNKLVFFLLITWFLSNLKSLWSIIFFLCIFDPLVQIFLFLIF